MRNVDIRVENFMSADILVLQWQGENFFLTENLKLPTFKQYTEKMLYHQRYSTDFQKHSFC